MPSALTLKQAVEWSEARTARDPPRPPGLPGLAGRPRASPCPLSWPRSLLLSATHKPAQQGGRCEPSGEALLCSHHGNVVGSFQKPEAVCRQRRPLGRNAQRW